MTIIFYGNRNTGLYVLSYLVAKDYNVKVITEDPWLEEASKSYNLELVNFDSMGEFDLFVCCHGRKIIPDKYLIENKFINIHPTLFKYKGHNPIKRYIANKDTEGSVESLYLTTEVDGGAVIHQEFFVTPVIATYAEFYNIALPYYLRCIDKTLEKLKV